MYSDVFPRNGGYAMGQIVTTTRYSVPTLRALEVVTLPARGEEEAPCHMPRTEP